MKPYYEEDGITIYHDDCAEILPALGGFDLLLTDPPYGIGEAAGKNKSRGKLAVAKDYGSAAWDDLPPSHELISLCRSVARLQVIFGGNYFSLPPSRCWLVWDKQNGASDFADAELAWTNLPMAVRLKRYIWAGMLQQHMGSQKEHRVHPTQKPLQVMTWALSLAGDSVKTVVDPFAGSGTSLVAAKRMGRIAVGIEREEQYCEAAAKRLAQRELFVESLR